MKIAPVKILFSCLALSLSAASHGAQISLTTSDSANFSSLTSGVSWAGGQAPSAANDYFTGIFFLRTPTNAGTSVTFAGNSLTLQPPAGQGLPMRSILFKGGVNTIIINNLTNAGGVINNGGSGNATATFTGNLMTVVSNSTILADQGPAVIGYPIVGSAGLTNVGSTQSGVHAVTYTGDLSGFTGKLLLVNLNGSLGMVVNLNAGSTALGNPASPTPDQITIGVGCSLVDNVGLTFNSANGGITLSGSSTIGAAATTVIGEPIVDLTNSVSSLSQLTSSGPGTLVLSNANNNYSGGTVISAGVLKLGVDNAIPGNTVSGNVTANGTLDLNGHNGTINGLNGAGTVDISSGGASTLTVGANGANGTFTGTIQNSSGTLSLTKIGAGTETLSGAFTHSGTTTVAGGTLALTTALGVPSTPGNLVISNGAALSADVSSGTSLPINNLVEATNSTLNLTLNSTANGINANGSLTFQDNAINNLNYGTVTLNPTAPFLNASGGISAPGTNIVINIAATGLHAGTFTLIKYTGAALGSIANFQLNPPPGVAAVLVNNTGNDSIDIQITSIPNTLSWSGVNGNNWDLSSVNWSNTVTAGLTVFQQYTNGSVIAGDAVTFDDTLTNDFVNPQPTNITLNTKFFAFPVVVNSTLPYSISGAGGITGVTSLLKTNAGTLTLNVSNSYTGGTIVAGGTLIITNDSALGTNRGLVTLNGGNLEINGSLTNNVRSFSIPAASGIGVSAGNSVRLGGPVNGTTLNSIDNGTLVLGGTNIYSGDLFIHRGTVVIDSGGFVTNNNFDDVGQNGTDSATLTLKGTGALSTSSDFNLGDLDSSAGTLNIQDTANLRANQFFIGSANAGGSTATGIVNQTGGTITEVSAAVGAFAIGGRTSTSGVGVYNMSGGTLTANAGMRIGGSGIGTLNQSGGTINALQGINIARLAGSIGTNNLNGGTLITFNVASSTGTNAIFNFNGGTLQAAFNPPNPWFSGLQQANVLAGGAIIDASTNNVSITQPLLAGSPNGGLTKKGVGTLTLTAVNTFTGPITNSAGTLSLNGTSTYPGAVVINGGTLSLAAANTLQGAVAINAGTLQMTTASTIQGSTTVSNGAFLSISQIGSASENLGNLTFNGAASGTGGTLSLTPTSSNNTNVAMVNCGTLTLNGTNSISVAAANVGKLAVIKYTGAIAGSGNITNLILSQGATGFISNDVPDSTLFAVITSTGPGLVWTGTNTAALNVWNISATTNWLVGATPTSYHQIIIPGDAVTFNDVGSGTVILNTNVAPAGMVISNTTKTYTFSGSGNIGGTTGIQKLGGNTAILNITNNSYSGATVVSNGTLQAGGASAISPNGNLVVGASGTLEMAGFPITGGELTGAGIVNNNSGIAKTLTVGSSGGGTWNGTITNAGGGGGVALTKNGTGTWVVGGSNYFNSGQPFTDHVLVNQGTVVLTNGGLWSIPTLELRIADGNSLNGSTSSVVVAGGTLIVTNNPLSVGVNSNNANGTLIVNSGTIIAGTGGAGVFAGSPNNIVVGGNGATGTMIVNGGLVTDGHDLWLGQNAGASGTLFLNGGVLQVNSIANSGGPATSVANFNGGTLQAVADSADFLQVQSMVMSNGLVLDDGGFAVSITSAALQDGDGLNGGLMKKGSGTLYLDAANTYTGTTLVTNGTLAGSGSIFGPLVVGPAGNIGAGDAAGIGTFTLNSSNVTLQGKATMRINRDAGPNSDQITGIGNISYSGILVISNQSTTALTTSDTFQLFNATTPSGNFTSIVGSPGAGLAYSFNPTTGVLSVITAVVKSVPRITSVSVSGTTLNIAGTNGTASQPYVLMATTNVALPVIQWTPLLTNSFDVNGNFNLSTNIVNPTVPRQFYLLSQ